MTLELLVNIDVPELDAGIAFYRDGLGFTLRRLLFGGTVAEMSCAGVRLFLIEKSAGSSAVLEQAIARDYRRHWTPVHLDIVVDDLDAAIALALHAGAQPPRVSHQEWGDLAPMSDPFGNGFCLIQFRGSDYDGEVFERPLQR